MTTSFDRRNTARAAPLRSDAGLSCAVRFKGWWHHGALLEEAKSSPVCPGRGRNLGSGRFSQPHAKGATSVAFGLVPLPAAGNAQLGAGPKPACFTFTLQALSEQKHGARYPEITAFPKFSHCPLLPVPPRLRTATAQPASWGALRRWESTRGLGTAVAL